MAARKYVLTDIITYISIRTHYYLNKLQLSKQLKLKGGGRIELNLFGYCLGFVSEPLL